MTRMRRVALSWLLPLLTPLAMHCPPAHAQVVNPTHPPLPPHDKLLRAIYQELIKIATTDSVGSCTVAAKSMDARLMAGGYCDADTQIIIPSGGPKKGNLVTRLIDAGESRGSA